MQSISSCRLTLSEELGNRLLEFAKEKPAGNQQCLTLVQKVYTELNLHLAAVKCMLDQWRVRQGLEYAAQVNLPKDACMEILGQYPLAPVLEVCTHLLALSPTPLCLRFVCNCWDYIPTPECLRFVRNCWDYIPTPLCSRFVHSC